MNHRHLLPEEIDLLLDGEVGFGVAPLKAHLDACADCRVRYDRSKVVFDGLEALPRLAPSFGFGDRIMAEVPVFVPWHVALRDSLRMFVPQSRAGRVGILAFAGGAATVLTLVIAWVTTQTNLLVVLSGATGEWVRGAVQTASRELALAVFGQHLFASLQQAGPLGFALAGAALLAVAAGTMAGLRAIGNRESAPSADPSNRRS